MKLRITLLFLVQLLGLSARAQKHTALAHTLGAESYFVDLLVTSDYGGSFYGVYSGQSLRYTIAKPFTHDFSLGLETGLFFHVRNGEEQKTAHSYLPLQVAAKLAPMDGRVTIVLSAGYPLLLTARDCYTGTGGFWYKDVRPSSENAFYDTDLQDAQSRKIDHYYFVSNLRLGFSLSRLQNVYATAGVQYYLFRSHVYQAGTWMGAYSASRGYCLNFSVGITYCFGRRKTDGQLAAGNLHS